MNQPNISLKQYFLSLRIIHFALIVGQLFMAGIFIYLVENNYSAQIEEYNTIFLIISIFSTFGAIFFGNTFYKTKLKSILPGATVNDKLSDYRVAMIVRFAILEGTGFLNLIFYFIVSNFLFLISTGIIIVAFFYATPTINKILIDLNFSDREKDEIISQAENFKS